MLERVARFSVRRRKSVLAASLVFIILSAIFGLGIFSKLEAGGFVPDDAESIQATRILDTEFDVALPNFLILVDGLGKPVDNPEVEEVGKRLAAELAAEPRMSQVASYWTTPNAITLKNNDGTKGLIVAQLLDPETDASDIVDKFSEDFPGTNVMVGGGMAIELAITNQVSEDLARAESIAMPLVILLLVFVFGGIVAAGLPVIVGVLSILGTFLVLSGFALFTDVSVFSINLVTMLGLGLGIDYSLFIVSRYREELKNGMEREAAIVRAVSTAGRTVMFSAIAIAFALAALLVFPVYFLRSFAYAGVSVVFVAAFASIVFLPALLAAIGPRINKWRVVKHKSVEDPSAFWAHVARLVMKRPIVVAVSTTLLLLLFAVPFLEVKWGATDDRVLPPQAPSHLVAEAMRNEFPSRDSSTLFVVSPELVNDREVDAYSSRLSTLKDVARVDTKNASYVNGGLVLGSPGRPDLISDTATAMQVVLKVSSFSTAGVNVATEVRHFEAPFETFVSGLASSQVDSNEPIVANLLPAAILLALGSFLILFLMTGSIVIPIKAILMASLSLTAALGAVVWIFQDGHLSNILGFTSTGSIDHTNVLVMFCIAFGLSMDYEVFLVSRIKEEYDRTGDTQQAIAKGLERTGRLVTAAALLISIVFLSFATSGITFIKLIGLGLAISIIVDATIVRGLLVPAFMRLMGDANWWAPKPLRKLHQKVGISESGE